MAVPGASSACLPRSPAAYNVCLQPTTLAYNLQRLPATYNAGLQPTTLACNLQRWPITYIVLAYKRLPTTYSALAWQKEQCSIKTPTSVGLRWKATSPFRSFSRASANACHIVVVK